MSIDWNVLLQTLLSTASIVAILAFVSSSLLKHLLERDIETMRAKFDEKLEEVKNQNAVDLEKHRAAIGLQVSQSERLRELIVRWANPILGAVSSLERRLNHILYTDGFPALSRKHKKEVNPNWSISYDYFMPSTLYLFAQYFCWVTLLEEQMSFEVFESQEEQYKFFSLLYEVKKSLEVFPMKKYEGAGRDMQVFTLQQRSIGEALIIREDSGSVRCMGYYEFLQQLNNPKIKRQLTPLKNLLENLNREESRWKRLKATHSHLVCLKKYCEKLLQLERIGPREGDGKEDLECTE